MTTHEDEELWTRYAVAALADGDGSEVTNFVGHSAYVCSIANAMFAAHRERWPRSEREEACDPLADVRRAWAGMSVDDRERVRRDFVRSSQYVSGARTAFLDALLALVDSLDAAGGGT